jgi:diacylglycerol kinase (ATP)
MQNDRHTESTGSSHLRKNSGLSGHSDIFRVTTALWNTVSGLREGLSTEAAIKQEFVIAGVMLPLSFFIAPDLWTWVALVGSLLFVLSIEFLNTAIERLCDHVQPDEHDAIRITKDLASAGVFFALILAGLVWIAAVVMAI